MRLSSHRLFVETGRWHRPLAISYSDRKCNICDKLDDEYHLVVQCAMFTEVRKNYINKYYWSHPSMSKFIELITSEQEHILKKLAAFIYHAFSVKMNII